MIVAGCVAGDNRHRRSCLQARRDEGFHLKQHSQLENMRLGLGLLGVQRGLSSSVVEPSVVVPSFLGWYHFLIRDEFVALENCRHGVGLKAEHGLESSKET